jgi:hypothetical protein
MLKSNQGRAGSSQGYTELFTPLKLSLSVLKLQIKLKNTYMKLRNQKTRHIEAC